MIIRKMSKVRLIYLFKKNSKLPQDVRAVRQAGKLSAGKREKQG